MRLSNYGVFAFAQLQVLAVLGTSNLDGSDSLSHSEFATTAFIVERAADYFISLLARTNPHATLYNGAILI